MFNPSSQGRISSAHAIHQARTCHVIFKRAHQVANSTKTRSAVIMAARRFSTSSRSFPKFYNIFYAVFVILNWRGLIIIPRNDFVPSDTRGMITDWRGVNYSTSICNLAGRHLGLFSCGRRGINTSLLFRREGFPRPVMYYPNSNAIFSTRAVNHLR